jgi:two-component system OmpR family response regulator
MRILLVEDDRHMADFINKGLRQEGFVVNHVITAADALELLATSSFDFAIVDVMLPGMDGVELVKQIRLQGQLLPIIFLSARGTVDDRISGLKAGADDYLAKPFSFAELVARIQTILRRKAPAGEELQQLELDGLRLDLRRHRASYKDQDLNLQTKEFLLLAYLLRNQERVVSKTMIMEQVWDYNFDPQTNVVEAKISKLRTKLAECGCPPLIRTVKGLGYICESQS